MPRVFGYAREIPGEHTLASDIAIIKAVAKAAGLEINGFFTDTCNKKTHFHERPGGRDMEGFARTEDTVIISRMASAFNRPIEAIASLDVWSKRGIILRVAELGGAGIDLSSTYGRLLITTLDATVALAKPPQRERADGGDRNLKGVKKIRIKGRTITVPCLEKQAALIEVAKLATDDRSLQDVVGILNATRATLDRKKRPPWAKLPALRRIRAGRKLIAAEEPAIDPDPDRWDNYEED